jgi:prostaglandin-endoperoxide synthase 2
MEFLIRVLEKFPALLAFANRFLIGRLSSSSPPRPHPFSLWTPTDPTTPAPQRLLAAQADRGLQPAVTWVSDYTSWPGLFDRTFTGRHLPPRPLGDPRVLPPTDQVVALFRRAGPMRLNPRSSALFCYFAQWFTDSFLRTHPTDPRRTTSNHEIDLCQIYGLDEPSTWALRGGAGGLLKSRQVEGKGEFPALLYADGVINPEFYDPNPVDETGLTYLRGGRAAAWAAGIDASLPNCTSDPARRDYFYASGLDRGGSTILYSAFNTIFLREHNRLARLLGAAYPDWDDNRLFETARLINIRQLLTVTIGDYIRHIGGLFPFTLDRTFAEKARWYRTNRISIEFDLLYRWHSLVPDTLVVDGAVLTPADYRYNNALLEQYGLEKVISAASGQHAGRNGLFNTPPFLEAAEQHGLSWARSFRLESFNAYRVRFGMKAYQSISEFADGDKVAAELARVYGDDVNAVEFTVGLFAEKRGESDVMPETVRNIVALDAFTHILTNPILATEVHCEATFSPVGWKILAENATLGEIIARNTSAPVEVSLAMAAG